MMESRFSQQLKKGVLELVILNLICQNPTYGYELLTQLKSRSGGLFTLKEGTLYPILYRLEDEGLIQAAWSVSEKRSTPQKIYSPTAKGIEENQIRQRLWQVYFCQVQQFLQGGDSL